MLVLTIGYYTQIIYLNHKETFNAIRCCAAVEYILYAVCSTVQKEGCEIYAVKLPLQFVLTHKRTVVQF